MVEIKPRNFIDVRTMPCQNSSWIAGPKIYGEGRNQIPLTSRATIDHLAEDQGYINQDQSYNGILY